MFFHNPNLEASDQHFEQWAEVGSRSSVINVFEIADEANSGIPK